MLNIFVAVLLVCAVQSARVAVRECPGGFNKPDFVESDWCTTEKCVVTRGQSFSARIGMTLKDSFSTLDVKIKATLFGIPLVIDLPPGYENGCDFLENAKCPTQPNGFYVWDAAVPVDRSYPAANSVDLLGTVLEFQAFLFNLKKSLQFKREKETELLFVELSKQTSNKKKFKFKALSIIF